MSILQFNNICKSINKRKIINNMSFSMEEGEIIGFVGPNGAGKTTTIRLITNLISPDSGSIKICEYNLLKEREKALSCISAIVETPSLFESLSGKENIDFIRKINNISKEKMNKTIDFIGLTGRINDKVMKYSLGMKQRLALGISLLTEPKLLILDEPTNGLDPSGTIDLRNMLISCSRENKMSILISSHLLSEIEKICNRIIYIKDGMIISSNTNDINSGNQVYKITFKDNNIASQFLIKQQLIVEYTIIDNDFYIKINKNNINNLLREFVTNNLEFDEIELMNNKLENDYISIFGKVDK